MFSLAFVSQQSQVDTLAREIAERAEGDADWSALRFRTVEYIRTMTRAPRRAITEDGRKRTGSANP